MFKRVLSLVVFALMLPYFSFAQADRISGRVVDKETQEPIQYASIGLKEEQIGALTNEYGYFQIAMPEKNQKDSLIVIALGFKRTAILVRKSDKNLEEIILEVPKREYLLSGVKVEASKVKPIGLGARSNTPGDGMIQGMPGTQYAFYVKNDKGKKLGLVRTVSFFIGEHGFPREPFRIRIYAPDGNYSSPNSDLLTENVVVSAIKGGAWYTIDLTQYNIVAPDEGFYVAMEWIVTGDKFYTTNFMDTYTPYGQILRPTFEFKESRTWNYTIGRGWSLITLANNGMRYNAMIKAEVDMYK